MAVYTCKKRRGHEGTKKERMKLRLTKTEKKKYMALFPFANIAEDLPNGMLRHQMYPICDMKVKQGVLTFVLDADESLFGDIEVPYTSTKQSYMIEKCLKKGIDRYYSLIK